MDLQKLLRDFTAALLIAGAGLMTVSILGVGWGIAVLNLPLAVFASFTFLAGLFAWRVARTLEREHAAKEGA